MVDTTTPRRQRWFQFRLRTLLIAMTLLAVAMGWFGWQVRIVRHRKTTLAAVYDKMRGTAYDFSGMPEFDDLDRPSLPWYRTIFGDNWQERIWIDGHVFSDAEIQQIREAFPESDLNVDFNDRMKFDAQVSLIAVSEIEGGRLHEQRPGVVNLPPQLASLTCDGKVYITRLPTGRLYLFKTTATPDHPNDFRGYIYPTVPLDQLVKPNFGGFVRIEAVAIDPEPADPKAGGRAVGMWAKRAEEDSSQQTVPGMMVNGWLYVSTSDAQPR